METVGTECVHVCMCIYVCVLHWRPPQKKRSRRSGEEDQGHVQASLTIRFLHSSVFVSMVWRPSVNTPLMLWFDSLFDAPGCVWGRQIGQSAYPGQEPGRWGQVQGHRFHQHPLLPCSINYPPSTLHPTMAVPALITWKQVKTSWIRRERESGWVYNVCACMCHSMFCMGTRHLSQQGNTLFHTNTVPFTHILTPTSQPSPPFSSPLLPGFPSSPPPLPGSFWFPFWFLTSGAISGWPAVPLILPAHCVASWAGPWAPGAGRRARNGLVPVAVLV